MARSRNKTERTRRRKTVAELRLQGKTLESIATEMGVDKRTVHDDLRWIERQWIDEAKLSYVDRVREKEADLVRIRNQAWDAYFISCTSDKPQGDPRFLEMARRCEDSIVKLYHLDDAEIFARNEIAAGGESAAGEQVQIVEVVVETREQVAAIQSFEEFARMSSKAG